ncbi:hypothetical protein AB205_0126830, partial [Aquarana catesbeiana]
TTGRQFIQLAAVYSVLYPVQIDLAAGPCYSLPNILQAVHSVSCSILSIYTSQLCAATSHCRPFLYIWPTRRGRRSQATKRGQAGSVSTANIAGQGHGASSAPYRVEPQHAEELVEWMTKPSSSSSSSVTQAQSTLAANAAAKAASSGSMSSVTPSLAPPSCPEESPELFDHSVGHMLQEDAQHFEGSDDGTQIEEGSNVIPERGGAQEGQQTGSHVPPTAADCQVCSSDEGMMRSLILRGCLIGERRRRRRHISNEAGCHPGASLRAAN